MDLLGLAILVAIIAAMVILMLIIYYIQQKHDEKKEKKFSDSHPEYMEFLNEFNKLQREASEIWNETMPECRREVDRCLEEIKYYPKTSERYLYLDNKLNVTKRKIEVCQKEYDEKENEIFQLVLANKSVIKTIKDDDFESYTNWVKRFHLIM